MITNPLNGEKHRKFEDIVDEYLSQIDEEERTKTYKLYRLATNKFMQFIGNGSLMEHIMAQKDKAVKHHNQHLHNPAKGYH